MGQKTHPKGFRLVTTQKHSSEWYSSKQKYPQLIEEDFFIRQKIEETFEEFLTISNIEINRIDQNLENQEYVNITVNALFPRAKEMYRKIAKYFIDSGNTLEVDEVCQNVEFGVVQKPANRVYLDEC